MRRTFDRERYERALRRMDEAADMGPDYYAALCELAEAQGRVPNPGDVARAEGRQATRAEWEAHYRELGVNDIVSLPAGARAWSGERSRSPWYLGTRERSRSPAPPRHWDANAEAEDSVGEALELEPDELEATRPPFEIHLTGGVCTSIEREVADAMWRFDGRDVETGGHLFSHYAAEHDEVLVVHATGPGEGSDHGNGSVQLGAIELHDLLAGAGLLRTGDWHSHPSPDSLPSDADKRSWATSLQKRGAAVWASVIVTPRRETGWMAPEFHGYVTREDENGVLVCDPAKVRES
jgi:hypothetical protein